MRFIAIALFAFCALGCSLTSQARSAEPSGFLGTDTPFVEGEHGEALLVYRAQGVDLSPYRRIRLEPVAVYALEGGALDGMDVEDVQRLVDYFDAALRTRVSERLEVTDASGADVAILRVALTEAHASKPLRGAMSTFAPFGLALSALKKLMTGSHTAVGSAQMEYEIVDSLTGKRLEAAVDARVGTKAVRDLFAPWSDTKAAMDFWSEHIAEAVQRLPQARRASRPGDT